MSTFRATWYELVADWWAAVAVVLAAFFGPGVVLDAALRRYESAEARTGRAFE
jgi:hypothetical protein